MIQGAIFDMDGTLIDSMGLWNNIATLFLEKRGLKSDKDLNKIFFSMTVEECSLYFQKEFHIPMTTKEIWQDICEIIQYHYENTFLLKPGVYDFLANLSQNGTKITVATASEREMAEAVFARLNINQFIDRIFTITEVGVPKTKPDIYYAAQHAMQTPLKNTWVFEDGLYAAKTAKNAGFSVCGVFDAYEDGQEELKWISDKYITTYEHLTPNTF